MISKQTGPLAPIDERPRLAEEIVVTLRHALLSGRFAPNERLGLEELAGQLGVSVMPVREALLTLAGDGLVEALPRRGFRAVPFDDDDLHDVLGLHAYLAGILAGRAAVAITPDQLQQLKEIHQEFVEVGPGAGSAQRVSTLDHLNTEFHRHINRVAKGDRLRWFLRLTTKFFRSDIYAEGPDWEEASLEDHPKIIEALEKHDEARARKLMEEHFRKSLTLSVGKKSPKVRARKRS